MKAHDELSKILHYEALIESKTEELIRLDALAKKMTAAMDGETVSRSRNLDPLGTVIANKDKLLREIVQLQDTYAKQMDFLMGIVDGLKNPAFIRILYGVYFHGKELTEIADKIGYSYRHTQNIRDDALQAVQKILDESERFHKIS